VGGCVSIIAYFDVENDILQNEKIWRTVNFRVSSTKGMICYDFYGINW
jgi:hypothetical protein